MKKKIYKFFITLMVILSLGSGPIAMNEIAKMLEALSGTGDAQVQELDEEEKESEEIKKRRDSQIYIKTFDDRQSGIAAVLIIIKKCREWIVCK